MILHAFPCQQHEFRAVINLHFGTDDEFESMTLCGDVRTHYARARIFIGDGKGAIVQCLRAHGQFFGMRGAAQKSKVVHRGLAEIHAIDCSPVAA